MRTTGLQRAIRDGFSEHFERPLICGRAEVGPTNRNGGERGAVTAVIPTIGRASLSTAVDSALNQRDVDVLVMLVSDSRHPTLESLGIGEASARIRVAVCDSPNGGAKRALGTELATTPWVAYLDDDDEWLPEKSARQLAVAAELPKDVVPMLSCQVQYMGSEAIGRPIPRTPYSGGNVAEYLFWKRRLGADRNTVPTSTLLLPTDLALRANWSTWLSRHQDWDFLLRVTRQPSSVLIQLDEPLVKIAFGAPGGLSRSVDWRASLEWARQLSHDWPPGVYADFIAGQVLRYALAARDRSGVREALGELRTVGVPSLKAASLASAGLLSRRGMNSALRLSLTSRTKKGPWTT